jgi:EAL domain-containing protein (putative c-di-GMP-specific phosphodiesterase class I)
MASALVAFRRSSVLHTAVAAGRTEVDASAPNPTIFGLCERDLRVEYQPQIDVGDGHLFCAEALVRGRCSDGDPVDPQDLVSAAEAEGLMLPLTIWVAGLALNRCHAWSSDGRPARIAINVAPSLLADERLVEALVDITGGLGVEPAQVELEVTESTTVANRRRTREVIESLRGFGFSLALDDFGTGFATLAEVQELPFDTLKIDRSFVHLVDIHRPSRVIVETSVELARRLGMKVVAEGVETERTWSLLRDVGCDRLQGFLVAPAMNDIAFERWAWAREASLAGGQAAAPSTSTPHF